MDSEFQKKCNGIIICPFKLLNEPGRFLFRTFMSIKSQINITKQNKKLLQYLAQVDYPFYSAIK